MTPMKFVGAYVFISETGFEDGNQHPGPAAPGGSVGTVPSPLAGMGPVQVSFSSNSDRLIHTQSLMSSEGL